MLRRVSWSLVILAIASVPASQAQVWEYYNFKDPVPLTLDTFRIAVLEPPSAAAGASTGKLRELLDRQKAGPPAKDAPLSGDMGGGWTLADLTGSPSGGDEASVVALIESIAQDPLTDTFASPVFVFGDVTLIVPPQIHVGFEADVPLSVVEMELANAGVGPILQSDWIKPNIFIVDGGSRSGIDLLDAANALAQLPDVTFATVDWMMTGERLVDVLVEYPPAALAMGMSARPFSVSRPVFKGAPVPLCGPLDEVPPNDPWLTESWGLDHFNDIDVDAFLAWQVCSGSPQVIAAVIDDGVQRDHPDLSNVLPGADFTDDCQSPPCLGDPQGVCDNHGTAIAGIINMAAGNGIGSAGVAPNVAILPIRAGKQWLAGTICAATMRNSWLVNAINYAVEQGARVTSLSWNFFFIKLPDVAIAYGAAYDAGVVNFNSAGNGNQTEVYSPGYLFEVNSISGINIFGDLFFVSPGFGSNSGPDIMVTGPGQFIFATDRTGDQGYEDVLGPYGGDYVSVTGTSHACPHISGTAALILAVNPILGPRDVAFILQETATDLGEPGKDNSFGYGLCNANASVRMAPTVIRVMDFERGNLSGIPVVTAN